MVTLACASFPSYVSWLSGKQASPEEIVQANKSLAKLSPVVEAYTSIEQMRQARLDGVTFGFCFARNAS